MPDISSNLGLNLPKGSDTFDYDVFLRQNFQKIDDKATSTDASLADIAYQISVIGDGVTSDSSKIQSEINSGVSLGYKNFTLPPNKTCLIDTTITLPSNITIDGQGSTLKGKTKSDVGKYTTCIFTSTSTSNITLKNLTFDGDTSDSGYVDTTDNTKVGNLLKFDTVTNLRFEKCKFTKFLSNVNTAIPDAFKSGVWAVMFIKSCENVKLIECELTASAIEGWFFWECTNVSIEKAYTNNTRMSTPISFLFCNGAKLLNSKILEDVNRGSNAGSTLNIYSKNTLIDGCYISGGTAFDVGNESEYPTTLFVQENLTISNNYIATMINSIYDDKTKHLNRNVRIFNNTIDATGFNYGIRTGNTENANIYNNTIIGASSGIRVFLDDYKNVNIYNNTFDQVLNGINLSTENNTISKIDIYNNKCTTQNVADANNGNGAFIVINNTVNTLGTEIVENISIRNNFAYCPNAWVWFLFSNPTKPVVTNVKIVDNEFDTLGTAGCMRTLVLTSVKSALIDRNNFKNIGINGFRFQVATDVTITNNKVVVYPGSAMSRIWYFYSTCAGYLILKGNSSDSATINHFEAQSGFTISKVETRDNVPDVYVSPLIASHFGTTANRPTWTKPSMYSYLDTTLGKPIWWNGSAWKDATGTTV